MRYPSFSTLEDASWYAYSDEPIQKSPFWKAGLYDPAVIQREDSPDNLWHLFANTWEGIEHYTSQSGFDYRVQHVVLLRGHSPFIFREGNTYYLLYETHDKDYLGMRDKSNRISSSRINMISSTDLKLWSKPRVLLSALDVPYASDYSEPRLSRPQLVMWEGRYRLYFGASHRELYDTGQTCTEYFSYAESDTINGPYVPLKSPIMASDPDSRWSNLALGSIKILPCAQGFAAIRCSFFFDEEERRSRSVMMLLTSEDGIKFEEKRILMPPIREGWASRYITSCDAVYRSEEKAWYCYFSANDMGNGDHPFLVRESLGLLIGAERQFFHAE